MNKKVRKKSRKEIYEALVVTLKDYFLILKFPSDYSLTRRVSIIIFRFVFLSGIYTGILLQLTSSGPDMTRSIVFGWLACWVVTCIFLTELFFYVGQHTKEY